MAKTISTSARNEMLEALVTNANWLELVFDDGAGNPVSDMPTGDFGVHAISFDPASGGSVIQNGTTSFQFGYTSQDQSARILGFKLFRSRQLIQGETNIYEGTTQVLEGEFTTPSQVTLDGKEYTINVSGITITLPESGA